MFVVRYRVSVRPDERQPFSVCWRTIAEAKRDHCGAIGSDLYAQTDGTYVVLEHWPDKVAADACVLPENYVDLNTELHGLCEAWEKTGEMELAESVSAS